MQLLNAVMTIGSGGLGTTTITVTPQNEFTSAVSFACSGLPAGELFVQPFDGYSIGSCGLNYVDDFGGNSGFP